MYAGRHAFIRQAENCDTVYSLERSAQTAQVARPSMLGSTINTKKQSSFLDHTCASDAKKLVLLMKHA